MGIMSAIVATYANVSSSHDSKVLVHVSLTSIKTSTPVPIFICAVLYIVLAIVAAAFPFEPYGKRSS